MTPTPRISPSSGNYPNPAVAGEVGGGLEVLIQEILTEDIDLGGVCGQTSREAEKAVRVHGQLPAD